jgi:hypothetical protein
MNIAVHDKYFPVVHDVMFYTSAGTVAATDGGGFISVNAQELSRNIDIVTGLSGKLRYV